MSSSAPLEVWYVQTGTEFGTPVPRLGIRLEGMANRTRGVEVFTALANVILTPMPDRVPLYVIAGGGLRAGDGPTGATNVGIGTNVSVGRLPGFVELRLSNQRYVGLTLGTGVRF